MLGREEPGYEHFAAQILEQPVPAAYQQHVEQSDVEERPERRTRRREKSKTARCRG